MVVTVEPVYACAWRRIWWSGICRWLPEMICQLALRVTRIVNAPSMLLPMGPEQNGLPAWMAMRTSTYVEVDPSDPPSRLTVQEVDETGS